MKTYIKKFINSNNIPLHWLFGISKFANLDEFDSKSLTFFRKCLFVEVFEEIPQILYLEERLRFSPSPHLNIQSAVILKS